MKGKKTMKNKISGKIVALLLTLIIVATSGMPLYAKETGDKANSFRYENGQPIIKAVPFATLSPNAWKKIDGKYYSSDGSVIEGAVAKGIDVSHHIRERLTGKRQKRMVWNLPLFAVDLG